ncbi:MAG: sigma-70 family RNA polymerase sigma factor [Paludibacter sp.]|jgi:RNA polymerase sigma-70 factor (ECF subfamily)|nr:sigma-70 family RNA polymerase sigma factor [Paludibacter sp.]
MDINIIKSYTKELRKGSHQAFNAIYEMYANKLYGFVFVHTKSRELSNDIVQDTFLKLWSMREEVSMDGSLHSLLITISYHKIVDVFRAQLNKVEFVDYIEFSENYLTDDNSIEKGMYYDEFLKALKLSKTLLPHRQLEIFEMSREYGLSIEEIARSLQINEQTVKNHLTIALKTLKKELSKYNMMMVVLFNILYVPY